MTDAATAPSDFASAGDDELVFGDAVPATPPRKPRRAAGKASAAAAAATTAAELPPSVASETAATEEPADPPAPVPQPGDASAGSAPIDAPRDRGRMLLLAIVGLALLTSLMSLGGLIAVSRTLAAVQAERTAARAERDALARLPATIAALDRAGDRLAAASRTAVAPAVPLTADDLHHALDTLRLALADREPAGQSAIGDTLHAGFAEIATRLDRIEARLDRTAPPPTSPARR